jgi:protein-tyrosine phosphatase
MADDSGGGAAFSILMVCTGNLCRSPVAERLLRARLLPTTRIAVSSAGLRASPGRPIEPKAERSLLTFGVTVDPPFVARSLSADLVAAADLVLTAERRQRACVAERVNGAWARTFTLREFARLVGDAKPDGSDSVERARALVAHATARRPLVHADRAEEDDVDDPMGRRYRAFKQAGTRIDEAVDVIARQVLGA